MTSLTGLAGFCGCASSKTPLRKLSKAELEADMAERLKLHEVKLTDQGGGRFTGTGKDAEGNVVELEVTQEERRRSWKNKVKTATGSSEGSGMISW
jgi:hypothetical protein